MEEVSTSEASVNFYQTTRRNIPEDSHLHTRRRENLKSHSIPDTAVPGPHDIILRISSKGIQTRRTYVTYFTQHEFCQLIDKPFKSSSNIPFDFFHNTF
jgi:hypothetical protein